MARARVRRRGWWALTLVAAVAAVAVFLLVPRRAPALRVALETVSAGTFVREVSGTGTVEAARERTLIFAGAGTVAEVRVRAGQRVAEGDALARLDTAALERDMASTRASLASAQADLERARAQQGVDRLDLEQASRRAADAVADATAQLADAERALASSQALFDAGGATRRERDAALDARDRAERALGQAGAGRDAAAARLDTFDGLARAQLAAGEAGVERLRTGLANAEQQLREATLTAPFAGVVGDVGVAVGDVVSPPTARGLRLLDDSSVHVVVRFDENRALELAVGQGAAVTPDAAPELRLPATVTRVSPVAERAQASAQVEAELTFGDAALEAVPAGAVRPGYTVTARVVVNHLDGMLLVPLEAIVGTDGARAVFRIEPSGGAEGVARRVPVRELDRNATLAAIEAGPAAASVGDATTAAVGTASAPATVASPALTAGDRIAVTNVGELTDGERVAWAE